MARNKQISQQRTNTKVVNFKKTKQMDQLLFWKMILWSAPIAGIIIGFIANFKINDIEQKMRSDERKKNALEGSITPRNKKNKTFSRNVNLIVGSNILHVSLEELRNGYIFKPFELFNSDIPISLKLTEQGTISVDCIFRDFNNKIVAEMKNNEWQINPNNYFKRNYDEHGLEVIDQDGITKFQIDFIDKYNVKFSGAVRDEKKWFIISDAGIEFLFVDGTSKEFIIKESEKISNMFVYPSNKNFGIRAKRQ